jgi:hypothetical protein
MSIDAFLHEIEAKLKTGQATEHTYRAALEALFNTLLTPARATNEPKQASYGAPDFIIQQGNAPIGHAEAKDVGLDLGKYIADSEREVPRTREGEQLRRYRAALPNLLYTDGLEWHWFVNGEPRLDAPVRVGNWSKASKKLKPAAGADDSITTLLAQFNAQQVQTVNTPRELVYRLSLVDAQADYDAAMEGFPV